MNSAVLLLTGHTLIRSNVVSLIWRKPIFLFSSCSRDQPYESDMVQEEMTYAYWCSNVKCLSISNFRVTLPDIQGTTYLCRHQFINNLHWERERNRERDGERKRKSGWNMYRRLGRLSNTSYSTTTLGVNSTTDIFPRHNWMMIIFNSLDDLVSFSAVESWYVY